MRPDGLRGQHLLYPVARVVCGHGIECGAPPSIGRDVGLGAQSLSGNIVRPCLTGEPLVESTPEAETRGLFGFGIPSAWPGDGSG
jgi:hypothetical protein